MEEERGEALKGDNLLAYWTEKGSPYPPGIDFIKECGYFSRKKNGATRIDHSAFYKAFDDARENAYLGGPGRSSAQGLSAAPTKPLEGAALLEMVQRLKGSKKSQVVRECGYVSRKESGEIRLNFTGFYEALVRAKNIPSVAMEREGGDLASRQRAERALAELRKRAQRKLLDGKVLSSEEIEALPDFQRKALSRGLASSKDDGDVRPMIGHRLVKTAISLLSEEMAEINICIKCGYSTDQIGKFRREFARAARTDVAPLSRMAKTMEGLNDEQGVPDVSAKSTSDKVQDADDGHKWGNWGQDEGHAENMRELTCSTYTRKKRSHLFRASVLAVHGAKCACCQMDIEDVIEAAHIHPVEYNGSDHPANGMPLCPTHHKAFDRLLFAVEPGSLRLIARSGFSLERLAITVDVLHLRLSKKALEFRMDLFRKSL